MNFALKYHFRPSKGWMNDPNGLVYFQGYYHAFFQYSPEHQWAKGPIAWGHVRTKDFLTWEELPIALVSDQPYDVYGCWSGTAIVKDDVLYLFYTAMQENQVQKIAIAYSTDGVSFEKYADNPIIDGAPIAGLTDFRDPAVMEKDGRYYLAVASGNRETKHAYLFYYQSDELLHWTYAGILKEWQDKVFCECPSLQTMGDKTLLSSAVVFDDYKRSIFSLCVGDFAGGAFRVEHEAFPMFGPDAYAGQIFTDAQGRHIMLCWIPGWEYMGFAEKSLGCLSLPMEVKFEDGRFTVYPVAEVQGLLQKHSEHVLLEDGGLRIPRKQKADVVFKGEIREMMILEDGYVIEVFINGGETVIAAVLC